MAKKVVIDPGHGGSDGGASANGIVEKNLNLDISKYMYNRFRELGIPVSMTRDSDVDLSSSARTKKALSFYGNGSDIVLISNHNNAGGGEGAEVIYSLRNSDRLARNILNNIENSGQVVRNYYQRRLPSNTSKDYYFILRDTPNLESIIVEYGFVDNLADANRLKNNYKKYAEAVVKTIAEYFGVSYSSNVDSNYYVVKKGDTLWGIAKKYSMSVNELKILNNLTSNMLSIGQKLMIVNNNKVTEDFSESNGNYVVKKGDTLYSIAKKYNTSVEVLKNINNKSNNNLAIGEVLVLPVSNKYIVKKGDTLYSIAKLYNVSVDAIKSLNNLSSNLISINQELLMP